jgi:leader peptidase (prepilin peptidase) / N-methyltransferase
MRLALFGLAGLLFGSFLTVLVHRLPRREPVRIGPRVLLIEVGTPGLFVAAGAVFPSFVHSLLVAPFLGLMLAVALIDARWRIVPNRIVYPALVGFGIALLAADLLGGGVDVVNGLVGMAAYAVPLLLLALVAPRGMGMGDVKLAALIGLVLGAFGLAYVAIAAAVGTILGGLGGLLAVVAFRYGRRQQIPFGPFLAAGAVVSALAALQILRAYVGLVT